MLFRSINGNIDSGNWYENIEYDTMSKTLFEKAEQYLNESKSLDKEFVQFGISKYKEKFPNALLAYSRILKMTLIIFDKGSFQSREIRDPLKWVFRSSSITALESDNSKTIEEYLKLGAPKDYSDEKFRSLLLVTKPSRWEAFSKNLTIDLQTVNLIGNSRNSNPGYIACKSGSQLPVVYVQANSTEELRNVFRAMKSSFGISDAPQFKEPK